MSVGPAMLLGLVILSLLAAVATAIVRYSMRVRRQGREAGYDRLGDYLRSAPRNDREKRDAVDLALQGVVICLLGLLFPPFLVLGLFPLYYGARKICLAWMGLEFLEEPDATNP